MLLAQVFTVPFAKFSFNTFCNGDANYMAALYIQNW